MQDPTVAELGREETPWNKGTDEIVTTAEFGTACVNLNAHYRFADGSEVDDDIPLSYEELDRLVEAYQNWKRPPGVDGRSVRTAPPRNWTLPVVLTILGVAFLVLFAFLVFYPAPDICYGFTLGVNYPYHPIPCGLFPLGN